MAITLGAVSRALNTSLGKAGEADQQWCCLAYVNSHTLQEQVLE